MMPVKCKSHKGFTVRGTITPTERTAIPKINKSSTYVHRKYNYLF